MLGASFLSTVIGTKLPGTGALWVSQSFDFKRPSGSVTTIEVSATVTGKHDGQRLLELDASIVNQRGETVLAGHGKVHVLEQAALRSRCPGCRRSPSSPAARADRPRDLHRARRGGASGVIVGYAAATRSAHGARWTRSRGPGARPSRSPPTSPPPGRARSWSRPRSARSPGRRRREQRLGPHHRQPRRRPRLGDVEAHLAVQTRSALELIQAALPGMRAAGAGRIVTITPPSSTRRRAAGPRTRWPRPR